MHPGANEEMHQGAEGASEPGFKTGKPLISYGSRPSCNPSVSGTIAARAEYILVPLLESSWLHGSVGSTYWYLRRKAHGRMAQLVVRSGRFFKLPGGGKRGGMAQSVDHIVSFFKL